MKTFFQNTLASLHRFHDDEQGIGAIDATMLLAVAAMVVIVILMFGQNIVNWMKGLVNQITHGGKDIKG